MQTVVTDTRYVLLDNHITFQDSLYNVYRIYDHFNYISKVYVCLILRHKEAQSEL